MRDTSSRLLFEIDHRIESGLIVGRVGVPRVIELVRRLGVVTAIVVP